MRKSRSFRLLAILLALTLLAAIPSPGAADEATDPDVEFLCEARLDAQASDLLRFLRQRSPPSDVDPQRLDRLIRELGSARFAEREKATQKLISVGPLALEGLRRAETDSDSEIARLAKACVQEITADWKPALYSTVVRFLVERNPPETVDALLGFLPRAAFDPELEEAIWFALDACAVRAGKVQPAFAKALQDKFPVRRAVAAYVLGRWGDPGERAAARKLLADSDPHVRLRAAQGLLGAKDKEAIPVLLALLEEPSIELAWQAEELLYWVAGEETPETTLGSGKPEARRRCREAWQAWWRRHGPTLDLDKPDQEYRRPGLVLVSGSAPVEQGQWRSEHQRGLVWLCGCDGKPRWRMTVSPYFYSPARLLPGGRLLMPLAFQVPPVAQLWGLAEYDLDGKVVWHYRWGYWPTAWERLPNGNTFLAGWRLRFVEVTREGKEVYSGELYGKPDLLGAYEFLQRIRSGRLFCYWKLAGKWKLAECDPVTGRGVRSIPLPDDMERVNAVEGLPGGRYLIAISRSDSSNYGRILEIDWSGKTMWQYPNPAALKPVRDPWGETVWQYPAEAGHAVRLPNGNTLIAGQALIEVNRAGKVVGEVFTPGHPGRVHACLNLVRLGFGTNRPPDFDLATSLPYRIKGLRSKDAFVRYMSAERLRQLGPKAAPAIPALIEALADPDEQVQYKAQSALATVGTQVIPSLIQAMKDPRPHVRVHAIWAVSAFGPKAKVAVPALIERLKDENHLVRRRAASAFWGIGPAARDAVPALAAALKDKDRARDEKDTCVSHGAASSLGRIGPEARAAVPALIEASGSEDVWLQMLATHSLGRIGSDAKAAVPHLVKSLQNKKADPRVRRLAAESLGKIGKEAKAAIPALREVMNDADEQLRAEAAKALEKIQH